MLFAAFSGFPSFCTVPLYSFRIRSVRYRPFAGLAYSAFLTSNLSCSFALLGFSGFYFPLIYGPIPSFVSF